MSYKHLVRVCPIREDGKILVLLDKNGRFVLPAGDVQEDEAFADAAIRVMLELTGCRPLYLTKVGAIDHPDLFRPRGSDPSLWMGFTAVVGDQKPDNGIVKTLWADPEDLLQNTDDTDQPWTQWFFDTVKIPYACEVD